MPFKTSEKTLLVGYETWHVLFNAKNSQFVTIKKLFTTQIAPTWADNDMHQAIDIANEIEKNNITKWHRKIWHHERPKQYEKYKAHRLNLQENVFRNSTSITPNQQGILQFMNKIEQIKKNDTKGCTNDKNTSSQ